MQSEKGRAPVAPSPLVYSFWKQRFGAGPHYVVRLALSPEASVAPGVFILGNRNLALRNIRNIEVDCTVSTHPECDYGRHRHRVRLVPICHASAIESAGVGRSRCTCEKYDTGVQEGTLGCRYSAHLRSCSKSRS